MSRGGIIKRFLIVYFFNSYCTRVSTMSFFIRNNQKNTGAQKRKKSIPEDNESIASTDEELAEEDFRNKSNELENLTEEEEETAQEKRLRLAKKYLQEIEKKEKDRIEFEEGAVSRRLHEEYLEEKGQLRKTVAKNYSGYKKPIILRCKEHRTPITCICISSDGSMLYSGSKNTTIVKWSLQNNSKLQVFRGKTKGDFILGYVVCLAISTDGKFLVAGDRNSKHITVLSGDDLKYIKSLEGHRCSVSGLAFRKGTHTLYSASLDKSVKVWNLDDMVYVETFFGHESSITSIDALSRERAITSGGYDGSIRIWKIVEDSQLIFNGQIGHSVDEVRLINDENFLSCGTDGKLCVWGCLKKKPLCTVPEAHGKYEDNGVPMWISSIATLLNTDLVASGSQSGTIKLWQCGENFRSLNLLFEIEMKGFVNVLAFTPDGKYLIAGVGQEPKHGRWWHISDARNHIAVIPLIYEKIL